MITKVEKVKRILHEPKRTKADENFKKTEVYKLWKNENYVDFSAMVHELKRRTHLPLWICNKVYGAEDDILCDLGIITIDDKPKND